MQICFYFPSLKNDQNNAIFGSMYSSFFDQLEKKGLKVALATDLSEIVGDILVVGIGGGGEPKAAKAMHKFKGPVIFNIYNAYLGFNKPFLKRWNSRVLFAYNTDFSTLNYIKLSSVNIKFYDIAFGSDESIFFPLNIKNKKYDITFLGNANSGFGREQYIDSLVKYSKVNNLNLFLAGAGWEKYGYPYQIIRHGAETNLVYNSSKICINIHNDRQFAGIDKEMDANNRLFDLAMAGCCQVSNGENMVSRYFNKDEVITADDPNEWIKKIDFYLKNEEEREKVCIKARERALNEHTWSKRADEFTKIILNDYPKYNFKQKRINPIKFILRYLDQHFKPIYNLDQIRIINKIKRKIKQ
jgi:glycosyltransferase involved in cell wall biosynthesis